MQTQTHTHPDDSTNDRSVPKPIGHPLGRLFTIEPMSQPVIGRLYAAVLVLAVAILLLTAGRLAPNGKHMGTHQQLKLPPCGFAVITGFPCPTCGMTTAYAYTVRGQFTEAIRSQIAGFVMAVATAGLGVIAAYSAVTGHRLVVNWYRINPTHVVWWLAALLVLAWAAKIILGLAEGTIPAR